MLQWNFGSTCGVMYQFVVVVRCNWVNVVVLCQKIFNDEFYGERDTKKPVFSDLDDDDDDDGL